MVEARVVLYLQVVAVGCGVMIASLDAGFLHWPLLHAFLSTVPGQLVALALFCLGVGLPGALLEVAYRRRLSWRQWLPAFAAMAVLVLVQLGALALQVR